MPEVRDFFNFAKSDRNTDKGHSVMTETEKPDKASMGFSAKSLDKGPITVD